jgi:WD40 repeat protein
MPMKGFGADPHGARGGSALLPLALAQSAPVTALAFSPDGKRLAVGGYRAVRLLDPETGSTLQSLNGPSDQVLSLAWSADGKRLAAAGGVSGVRGEVCVWEADTWKQKLLKDHSDAVYSVSWRPGAAELASGSLDKTVKIWNVNAGTVIKTLKDHVDAVFGVAYSADGKWLATGSMDRSLKLYDAATRERAASYVNPEGVTAVAFSPKNDLVVCASDKQLKVWPAKAGAGDNPLRTQHEGESISAVAFSADGSTFAWGAVNRRVKVFNDQVTQMRRELQDPIKDWVYAVALSPDGKRVAAGTGEGKLFMWNPQDGKLVWSVGVGPSAPGVAAAEVKP